jgi:hypothetical protein
VAKKLCEEADVSGSAKCPHQRARGIEGWTPTTQNKLFLFLLTYQNILLMVCEWEFQGKKPINP